MEPERRRQVEAVFEAALAMPPTRRHERVDEACAGDEALRASVLRLLHAHDRAEGILEEPVPRVRELSDEAALPAQHSRIGPYRLVREIGRGGMSIVYLAERDDRSFRQTVAVKLIRRGLDTPDLVRRFCAERQILASLRHPNVAALLDGGTTVDGLPYLVMEYVDGEPVTEYCDRRRLTVEQRLRLFMTIARTVQHAHRNLVVHRDLKPSNILVTEPADVRFGMGEVKLLDFGIAKLLDPRGSLDTPPPTHPGVRLMTPEYASPEQLRGEAITTATDVYGLGLILYEVLTGCFPFPRERGSRRGGAEEREPLRPSLAVGDEADAAARGTHSGRLRRMLRGDLDRIALMALRVEPERRYASAEQLAEDIENHLRHRPIRARGDAVGYRVGRFVARHRWGAGVAAAFVLVLGGYAATLTVKEREVRSALERAGAEAERAEQVTGFLMRLFEPPDPGTAGPESITARELLERGVLRADEYSHRPDAQAQMLDVIGRTYQYLGNYDRAQPLLERALDLRREVAGAGHPGVSESLYNLARLHHERGHLDSAESLFRRTLRVQRSQASPEEARLARTIGGMAGVLRDAGQYEEAEILAREALGLRRRAHGDDHPEVAESLHDLAEILRRRGRYGAAEPLYRESIAVRERLLGASHPAVAQSLYNLAYVLQRKGDLSEVESLYGRALAIYRTRLGDEHPAVASATSNLGLLRFRMGDLVAADSLYRRALEMRRATLGPEHPEIAVSLGLLAAVQRRKGRLDHAEELYRESLAMQRRLHGSEHPDMGHGMNGLALVLRDQGRFAAADSLYEETIGMRLRLLGPEHPAVATSLNDRGVLMREQGDYARAESLLLQALRMRRATLGDGHLQVERSVRNLITLYERWGRPDRAESYRQLLADR
jgi:eukaryotic-like serine/threonine-protein kinase